MAARQNGAGEAPVSVTKTPLPDPVVVSALFLLKLIGAIWH
jgi:hypothetical protein